MDPLVSRLAIATVSAFAGGAAAVILGRRASRRVLPLVFIALGTLLAVTLFDVLPDAKHVLTWGPFLVAGGSGFLVFWLISRYLYTICPACAACELDGTEHVHDALSDDVDRRLSASAWLLTGALTVHCVLDGLAVVVGDNLARGIDLPVLVAITVHKFPEGMALALFLLSAGRKPVSAFLWTVVVESTTLIGGLVGAHLLNAQSTFWMAMLFAHVGGGFLFLVATTMSGMSRRASGWDVRVVLGGGLAFTVTSVLLLTMHGR
ncbi:MAG: ZIP family metal transporter [Capsulimonadaceae bacterium]